jgi:hypothetical protein
MNDLDRKIQAALRGETSTDELGAEPNLVEELMATFRGRHRLLSGFAVVLQLVALAGFVLALLRFLDAPDVIAQLRWGGLAGLMVLFTASIKIWFWLELHTNRILREVKRVELLLVTRGGLK